MQSALRARLPRLALALLVAAGTGAIVPMACSDDTTTTVDVGYSGPPAMRFVAVGGQTELASGVCVPIGDDPDYFLPLEVAVQNLYLRPPGLCAAFKQCGYLRVTVRRVGDEGAIEGEGVINNRGASTVVPLLLRKLADRYAALEVEVELMRRVDDTTDADAAAAATADAGVGGEVPVLDHDGHPIRAWIVVEQPDGGLVGVASSVKITTVATPEECTAGTGGGGQGGGGQGGSGGQGGGSTGTGSQGGGGQGGSGGQPTGTGGQGGSGGQPADAGAG